MADKDGTFRNYPASSYPVLVLVRYDIGAGTVEDYAIRSVEYFGEKLLFRGGENGTHFSNDETVIAWRYLPKKPKEL